MNPSLFAALVAALLATGCVSIRPVVVSKKTQIENQIVGEIGALQHDLILAASVRSMGADDPDLSPAHREALVAMMNRQFRLDDVVDLKRRRVLGEAMDGTLHYFPNPDLRANPAEADVVKALVEAENADRDTIMQRIIDMNPGLDATHLPEVQRLMHELNVERSELGTLVEDETGEWKEKIDPRLQEEGA